MLSNKNRYLMKEETQENTMKKEKMVNKQF